MIEQRLLDAGIVRCACRPPVLLALPETDCALIYPERGPKRPLGQPSQNAGGAELTACDEVFAVSVLSQLEGVVGTKNNDHLVGDSPGDATAAVSTGANWLIGGSGSDLIEGRGGNDVIIGGSIRLDTLIGSYAGG